MHNQAQKAVATTLSDIAARTSTVTGSWVSVIGKVGDLIIEQKVGTVSGTTPTLDGKIQHASDGSGTGAADITGATFTQVTASNSTQIITIRPGETAGYIRFVGTIAGTTPSFTMGVTMIGNTAQLG